MMAASHRQAPNAMQPTNFLFLCSDQHARNALGCYGHPIVQTPNLDALAARGTRFTTAYTNSPICVPARASMATGRYLHQHRAWSSAEPYDGQIKSWGHRLMENGCRAVSAGKLHYRNGEDANGFDPELLAMHMGIGWTTALLRGDTPALASNPHFAGQVGWGESDYTRYDRATCKAACQWLGKEAPRDDANPWGLFVSFVSPHNPLTSPEEFSAWYPPEQIEMPNAYSAEHRDYHPVVKVLEGCFNYDESFRDEGHVREARRAYYGLCSFMDQQIGLVLDALEETGQTGRTRIIYTADHGEMLGHMGLWAKSLMYEDSAGVPMIAAGPDIPAGEIVDTPVTHVDCYPTILQAVGITPSDEETTLPGHSLVELANRDEPERTVLSEYHDGGAITGMFMIRDGNWKYVCYPGYDPQLFDLKADPDELVNRSDDPACVDIRSGCEAKLRTVVDPDEANARAFADQEERMEALGGREALLAAGDRYAEYSYTPAPVA